MVVHLAAYLGSDDWEGQLSGNVIGAYNVYEAARAAGVKRVVFASSGNAIRGFEAEAPYDAHRPGAGTTRCRRGSGRVTHKDVHPLNIYGVAKVWGETLGHHFSDQYGMSVLCVRIGRVTRSNVPEGPREMSTYLSHDDVSQILHLCVDAPDELRYDVFLATSNNRWGYRDLEHPREVLGYVPQDSAEEAVS